MANREQVGLDVGPALTTRLGSAAYQILHRRGRRHVPHVILAVAVHHRWIVLTVSPASAKWFVICTAAAPCWKEMMSPSRATSFLLAGSRRALSCNDFPSARRSTMLRAMIFPLAACGWGTGLMTPPLPGGRCRHQPVLLHTPAQRVRADSNASIEVEIDDDRFVIEGGQNLPAQLPPIGQITAIFPSTRWRGTSCTRARRFPKVGCNPI